MVRLCGTQTTPEAKVLEAVLVVLYPIPGGPGDEVTD